jgi:hypothetical protein
MPQLENPKHEAFAMHLARGLKQQDAYAQAGYTPNPPAASRLGKAPAVKARVDELKKEIHQRIQVAMKEPNEETFESLREMGLTMHWVADAFKTIYEESMQAGQFAPATAAVKNIQTLIEIEKNGAPEEDHSSRPKIDVADVTAMLKEVRGIVEATQGKEKDMVDVTPDDFPPAADPPKLIEIEESPHDNAG